MRARWASVLAVTIATFLAAAASPAAATDPVDLGSSYVVDQADVLTPGEEAAADARLTEMHDTTGLDLWVVYVDEFTNPAERSAWADAVAEQNGLGASQYLLAVATDGRQYYLSADSTGPLSDAQLSEIEAQVRPYLSDEDWSGAVDAAAEAVESTADSAGGGFPWGFVLIALAVVVLIVVFLAMRRRSRRAPQIAGAPASAGPAAVPMADLERQASSLLIDTDDALKTSAQELEFARAQFGDAATADFQAALAAARTNLDEAFSLRQRLDDEVPDTEADARAWTGQIIALCTEANTSLDEKAADFDELRKLEQNAPEALARTQSDRAVVAAAIGSADEALERLRARYAAESLATIADNPAQARERVTFADGQLTAAQKAIGEGQAGEAAVGIRAAEESLAQAALLRSAIDKLGADLAAAEQAAPALIAELENDLVLAAALPDPDGRVATTADTVRKAVDNARAQQASTTLRPLQVLQNLEAANTAIDSVTQSVRDAQAQAQRAQQMLAQVRLQAQAQVSAAEDYITARRGAVGAEARTRLAEAGASLVRSEHETDPILALQHAQRADQLAGQALQRAQSDVGAFSPPGGFGGGSQSDGGMMGAMLGGIVINSLLSGGRSSGGSLGGLGGMMGGGGSARRGGMRAGSFGGGGTRGRRGGGRF